MTIKQEYVVFGILACILAYVLYFSQSIDSRIDDNKKLLKSLQDSVGVIHSARTMDSLRIESLKVTVDSIKTAKATVIRRATHERTVIRNASADSLAAIVRSGLDSLQR